MRLGFSRPHLVNHRICVPSTVSWVVNHNSWTTSWKGQDHLKEKCHTTSQAKQLEPAKKGSRKKTEQTHLQNEPLTVIYVICEVIATRRRDIAPFSPSLSPSIVAPCPSTFSAHRLYQAHRKGPNPPVLGSIFAIKLVSANGLAPGGLNGQVVVLEVWDPPPEAIKSQTPQAGLNHQLREDRGCLFKNSKSSSTRNRNRL